MQKRTQRTIERIRQNPQSTWVVLGGFLCALLLSRVRLHTVHAPFALGLLLGAQLAAIDPLSAVGGVILGAFAGAKPLFAEAATALVFWAATRIALTIRKTCRPVIRLLIFLLCSIAALPLCLLYGTRELLYGALSIVVSTVAGLCFHKVYRTVRTMHRDRTMSDAEQAAIVIVIGLLLASVSDLSFFGWSLSAMLLLTMTALLVSARGVFGAAAGTLWSSMLVLYAHSDAMLIGSVAVGALIGTALRERGKPFVLVSFFLSGILFETYAADGALAMNAQNLLCGLLIYLVIPRAWIEAVTRYTDASAGSEQRAHGAIERIELGVSEEMERMGQLLSDFSGMFRAPVQEEDAVKRWTVKGALTVCQGCEVRRLCWKDAQAMGEAVVRLAEEAGKGTRVTPIAPIDECCRQFGDLCASVLLAYQQANNRNAVSLRAERQAELVDRQFTGAGEALLGYAKRVKSRERDNERVLKRIRSGMKEIGCVLDAADLFDAAEGERLYLSLRRPVRINQAAIRAELERICGFPMRCIKTDVEPSRVRLSYERASALRASMNVSKTKNPNTVSGDATGECRLPGGHVCFALSDGMGSGKKARQESEAAIDMLFRLYRAGMRRELIYENVNRLLLSKNETEMYATLDAVSIDLNTGEAELLKYGAPPCFLVRGKTVRTFCGESLPCGILEEARPSVIRMKLKPKDLLILCSDGVQDVLPEGTETALRSLFGTGKDPGELLLKLAESRGSADDMTVVVVRVA